MKPEHLKLLSIAFAALTVFSIFGIYYTHQLPLYENKNNLLCTYLHKGTYDYKANLLSNTIYNRTNLRPGEGTLYTAIVEQIDLNFKYSFASNPQAVNFTVSRKLSVSLESPDKWNRTLTDEEAWDLLQLEEDELVSMMINETKIMLIIERIEEETGISVSEYNLNVRPEIHVEADLAGRKIEETFIPELKISFITGGDKGNYIEMNELVHSEPGEIKEESQVLISGVEDKRAISIVAMVITPIALVASVYQYLSVRPETPTSKKIEKLVSQYEELITESTQGSPKTRVKIDIETLEDLAKTAEILARPIIHHSGVFYVLDGDVKYQFSTPVTADVEEE